MINNLIKQMKKYNYPINNGISNEYINDNIKNINIILPKDYLKFLNIVNGFEFDGYIIYSIDNIEENNKIWYENEYNKKYVFLGDSNISFYVYESKINTYFELDKPSGEKINKFNNFANMLNYIFKEILQ